MTCWSLNQVQQAISGSASELREHGLKVTELIRSEGKSLAEGRDVTLGDQSDQTIHVTFDEDLGAEGSVYNSESSTLTLGARNDLKLDRPLGRKGPYRLDRGFNFAARDLEALKTLPGLRIFYDKEIYRQRLADSGLRKFQVNEDIKNAADSLNTIAEGEAIRLLNSELSRSSINLQGAEQIRVRLRPDLELKDSAVKRETLNKAKVVVIDLGTANEVNSYFRFKVLERLYQAALVKSLDSATDRIAALEQTSILGLDAERPQHLSVQ